MTFTYYRNTGSVKDREDVERNRIGTLQMYPFKRGEIAHLLERAGFADATQYSGFRKGCHDQADFFTYAAREAGCASGLT